MPTDKERWEAFLTSFGVKFTYVKWDLTGAIQLIVKEGQERVNGYNGFLFTVNFTKNGKFLDMGIYEE